MSWNPTSLKPTDKAIVLLSGGLDSAVALGRILTVCQVAMTLTFNYGQRASGRELKASTALAQHYELPHQVIPLPWLAQCLPDTMDFQPSFELAAAETDAPPMDPDAEAASVWIPNRNGLFLNIAASFAEALGAQYIVFGANADEARNFPDNTQAFRDRMNDVLALSTLNHVQVLTPVGDLTKAEIMETGLQLGVPLETIWSCYEAGPVQCGVCPSCRLLRGALAAHGPSAPRIPFGVS
jgi:7-cyano-7-deazaguanine synthase